MKKKIILYIFIILLVLSMYHDLRKELIVSQEISTNHVSEKTKNVMKVRVKPGDTILSLIEEVNEGILSEIDINQLVSDFKQVNEHMDTNELEVNKYYYVPLYK